MIIIIYYKHDVSKVYFDNFIFILIESKNYYDEY